MPHPTDMTVFNDALAAYKQAANATEAYFHATYKNPRMAWERFLTYCAFRNANHAIDVMRMTPHLLGDLRIPIDDPVRHARRVDAFAADHAVQAAALAVIVDERTKRAAMSAAKDEPTPKPAVLHRKSRRF